MSDKGSVFQTGGGGTNFEQSIQTAFIVTLMIRGNVPCVKVGQLIEVALQVKSRGYHTDDLLAIVKNEDSQHRLLIQAKHDISFSLRNEIFQDVITSFWKDFNNTLIFDKTTDKLIIANNGLTKEDRNHLKSIFNWAVNHATENDFIIEVNRFKGKKERLDIFRELLKKANNDIPLNDKELWDFLKCVDVLEYDFLNDGSVDKSNFLNLIKLSKNNNSNITESEIWDSIFSYCAILNKDGGSINIENIEKNTFFKHFNNAQLSPYFKAVEKLRSDSKEILRPIKTTIGTGKNELHLQRIEITEKILSALSNYKFTIVTGKPGFGKSAKIKEILQKDFPTSSIFAFRADQFNEPTLSNVLSSQGVNETIQDIFSCISLIPEKIIFIDSLEKLLEADPECAFKQLLALLKDNLGIRIIASSRQYAIDLVTLKFGIDKKDIGIIDIPELDESELKLVSEKFPQLKNVLRNVKIKKLLQSPKYLDFAILAINKTNDNYADVSLTEFKEKLWNSLVVDSTNIKNGLPIKREHAFMEIALKRAKEMKLFTTPDKSDAEAIICLENDEIVFQENQNRKYSPTHDILEDWALVKYISLKFSDYPNPLDLYSNIGNEPAIRRAFRLWVEDYLIDNSSKLNDLIVATVSTEGVEKYWADELLIAIFKSENCNSFFESFEKELLKNNANFLNRCLHIIKTCCKESDENANNDKILLPSGSGWKEALIFIHKHIHLLDSINYTIINFLEDWYFRLLLQYSKVDNIELGATKSIVLHYLNGIENQNAFWLEENIESKSTVLTNILFDLAEISKVEIEQLISRAFVNKENRESWRLNSFYENVIEKCLSGIGNQNLIKVLPEMIINTAWKYWKYIAPNEKDYSDERIRILANNSLRDAECWGLRDKHSFFPSGVYKTPAYNLLKINPLIGLKFIVDILNYSIEFYANSTCNYKHNLSRIEIENVDETKNSYWGAWELWAAYRGLSVTNYLIESLLMSLEKYLLEIASLKTETSRLCIKELYEYIYRNSNNVAPFAVLTSVAMAYPEEVEDGILPLLSAREFYEWDLSRASREHSSLAIVDSAIPFAQDERSKSNHLSHRKKYLRGWGDFILDYQFNIKKLNPKIHASFDKLNNSINDDDIIWKKRLNELDIRKWEVKPYDEGLGGYIVQPKYEQDVVDFLNSDKDYVETQNTLTRYSAVISKAYDKTETLEYAKWVECYEYYSNLEKFDIIFSRPITLAVLGLRDLSNDISISQRDWCTNILIQSINSILHDSFNWYYEINHNFNLMEKEIALSSFHLLMQNVKNDNETNELIATMICTLFAPFNDPEIDYITKYFRETFFMCFPIEAKRVWLGLIKYSKYKKSESGFRIQRDSAELKKAQKKQEKFIENISTDKEIKLNLPEISFENHTGYILARAFVIIPCNTPDLDFKSFIMHFLPLLTEDLKKKENYSYSQHSQERQVYPQSEHDIQLYLAELLFTADSQFAKSILDLIVDPNYQSDINITRRRNDLFEFTSKVLDNVIYKLDQVIAKSDDENSSQVLIDNFWVLWSYFFDKIVKSEKQFFLSTLFLDISWVKNAVHWKPLENKTQFYQSMIKQLGKYKATSVVNMLSTIGEKTLLPESISLLTNIFKTESSSITALLQPSMGRMIRRLFYNHITTIKNDKTLMNDYIWILNRLVDLGSSDAYLFRENVITYKKII